MQVSLSIAEPWASILPSYSLADTSVNRSPESSYARRCPICPIFARGAQPVMCFEHSRDKTCGLLLSFGGFGQQNSVAQPPAAATRMILEQSAVHVRIYLCKWSMCFTEVTALFEQSTYTLDRFLSITSIVAKPAIDVLAISRTVGSGV